LQYTSTSSEPSYDSTAPATVTRDNVNSSAGLILEQNLWRNFFGNANRADLRAADATLKAANISRITNLQKLVLNGIQAFWSTFVAQETYQEAVNSRDRYKKLVDSVKKKTGYGYNTPGELAQAQAELENREQTLRNSFVTYQAAKDELITLLRLPPGRELQFAIAGSLPNPPVTNSVDVEKLRPQKTAKLTLQAAEDTLHSTESKAYPDLSFVGKVYTQGYDSGASEASRELTEGNHPRYYVGVRFQYNFGSGYQNETVLNKRLARDLANTQYERQKLELKDQESDIRRRIESTYEIVKSAQTQKDLREKAIQQLNRSYTQGRTDIAILIDAMNKFFDSEVQLSRAIGNYQTALSEWAAFRDELVLDSTEFSN
jgi:outer membrane protein TolC